MYMLRNRTLFYICLVLNVYKTRFISIHNFYSVEMRTWLTPLAHSMQMVGPWGRYLPQWLRAPGNGGPHRLICKVKLIDYTTFVGPKCYFCKNLTDFDQISLKPYLTDFSPQQGVYVPLRALYLVVMARHNSGELCCHATALVSVSLCP